MILGSSRKYQAGLALLLAFLIILGGGYPAAAQGELPEGVPDDADATAGMPIFQQRCSNCHGPEGLGDGELAAQLPSRPAAIGSEAFQSTTDPEAIFLQIQNGNVTAGMPGFGMGNNSDPLTEAQIWDVVAAVYQLPQLSQPLPEAVVTGVVLNGSTGELSSGLTATLQAFDPSFNEALRLDTEVADDGAFRFDLKLVPPSWVYRVIINYNDFDFTSGLTTIDAIAPEINLPVTIYETTISDIGLRINQLQVLVEFGDETVQISEMYIISNESAEVYVGPTGDVQGGTVALNLPEGAQNVRVMRGFGGATNFVPLGQGELVREGNTLRPQLPVGPGAGTMRLLLHYELLYERGLTLERPLPYTADIIEALVPEIGVTIGSEGGWQQGDPLPGASGSTASRIRYSHPSVQRGENLLFSLEGWPETKLNAQGQLTLNRDEQSEMVIGGISLLVVAVAAGLIAYRWRSGQEEESERDQLLGELAALEEAFEEGSVRQSSYRRRRSQLIEALTRIWE